MAKIVAIVEDDPAIRANYTDLLKKHGYQVSAFADRGSALAAFRSRLPDLALLDIGLPGEPDGGFALCRELRALSAALPIIFLTARDSDFDVISGLRMGADDYLTKDAGIPHLLARISALFRRADLLREPPLEEEILERGEPRAREEPRAAHEGSAHRGGRLDHHLAREAHPAQVPGGRPRVRGHRHRVRARLPLE
jgi:two-component system OmpR family response regulator